MLPPSYRAALPAEAAHLLASISQELPTASDAQSLTGLCRSIENYMQKLKYPLVADERVAIAQRMIALAFGDERPPLAFSVLNKVLRTASLVIRKKPSEAPLAGKLELDWRPMYQQLAETYLSDESFAPGQSSGLQMQHRRALTTLIHSARHYWHPGADREIWAEVAPLLRDTRCNDVFRGVALLVLFLPSDSDLFAELLPQWMELWARVDYCPWWDSAWLTLLCRARKAAAQSDAWVARLPQICAQARLVVPTPAGQGSTPEARVVPMAYRQILTMGSEAKLAKLLMFCVRRAGGVAEPLLRPAEEVTQPPPREGPTLPPGRLVSPGARMVVGLLRSYRNYFYPSNAGAWTVPLAALSGWLAALLAREVGAQAARDDKAAAAAAAAAAAGGMGAAAAALPNDGDGLLPPLRIDDVTVLIETLLPLTSELIYSKYSPAQDLAQRSLCILSGLSPRIVAPVVLGLALRAVDPVGAILHAHQAPTTIRALGLVLQPLLYPRPLAAPSLPLLLEYTLPGIDPNDVTKTLSTVLFYVSVLAWLPVLGGGGRMADSQQSTEQQQPPPLRWVDARAWPAGTDEAERGDAFEALEALGDGVMLEWSLALLDRLIKLMESRGRAAKQSTHGADTMNTAAALAGSRGGDAGGFAAMLGGVLGGGGSRDGFLSYCIITLARMLFTQMDAEALKLASRHVVAWVTSEVVPHAAKDASMLLQCLANANPASATAALVGPLTADLSRVSSRVVAWRLRLLGGLCTNAGPLLPRQASTLTAALRLGFAHEDRHVRKCAGKALRRILYALLESYPLEFRSLPADRWANVGSSQEWRRVGEPQSRSELRLDWHEPSVPELRFAAQLLEEFVAAPAEELLRSGSSAASEAADALTPKQQEARRAAVKHIEYGVRGSLSMLSDLPGPLHDDAAIATGTALLERLRGDGSNAEDVRLYELVSGLRASILRFTHEAIRHWGGEVAVDVKLVRALLSLATRMMEVRGVDAGQANIGILVLRMQRRRLHDQQAAGYSAEALRLLPPDADPSLRKEAREKSKIVPRHMQVERAYLQRLRRQHQASWSVPAYLRRSGASGSALVAPYEDLFADFVRLAAHPYSTVRAAAQEAVFHVSAYHGPCVSKHLPALLDRLAVAPQVAANAPAIAAGSAAESAAAVVGEDSAANELTGAMYLLHQRRFMRRIVYKWPLLSRFLLSMCTSQALLAQLPADRQVKASARLQILFSSFIGTWDLPPMVTAEDVASYESLVSGLLGVVWGGAGNANIIEAIDSPGDAMSTDSETDAVVVQASPPPPLPAAAAQSALAATWRRELMASWALNMLVAATPPPTLSTLEGVSTSTGSKLGGLVSCVPVWRWFVASLIESLDRTPTQELSLESLWRLLAHRAYLEKRASAAAAQATASSGNNDSTNGSNGDADWATITSPSDDAAAIAQLLSGPGFLRAAFRALAMDHGQGEAQPGQGGRDQAAHGVDEIVDEASRVGADGAGSLLAFPTNRISRRSGVFSSESCFFVERLVLACGGAAVLPALVAAVVAGRDSAPLEERRAFLCSAAEVVAGAARALCGPEANATAETAETAAHSWTLLLPLVEQGVAASASDAAVDWADGIRWYLNGKRWPGAAAQPLLAMLTSKAAGALAEGGSRGDFAAQTAALQLLQSTLMEAATAQHPSAQAWLAATASDFCPLLVRAMDTNFESCRNEVSRCLLLLTCFASAGEEAVDAAREAALRSSSAAAAASDIAGEEEATMMAISSLTVGGGGAESTGNGNSSSETKSDQHDVMSLADEPEASAGSSSADKDRDNAALKALGRRRETVGMFLSQAVRIGDVSRYLEVVVRLLPAAFEAVASGAEVAAAGRYAVLSIAQGMVVRDRSVCSSSSSSSSYGGESDASSSQDEVGGGDALSKLVDCTVSLLAHPVWHVRLAAVQFAAIIRTKNLFVLTASEHDVLDRAIVALLGDAQREVQEQARTAVSARVSLIEAAAAADVCQRFAKACQEAGAAAKKRRRTAKAPSASDPVAEKQQQAAVLGLSAMVLSAPYDVPAWLPQALVTLAQHSDGRLLVGDAVAHAFKEFRRTHQEDPMHRLAFTADQLEVLNDVAPASYMV